MTRLLPLSCIALFLLAALPACDPPKSANMEAQSPTPIAPARADEESLKEPAPSPDEAAPSQDNKPSGMAEPNEVFDGMGVGATPADINPGEQVMYGKKTFALAGEPISLKDAIAKAEQGEGPYKVATTIEKVCQQKGCWFTLSEEGVSVPIRVRMKDYKFFVPKNAGMMPVLTEGTFKKTTISQEMAQHYADDEAKATGKPARVVTGPEQTYEFTATVVEIQAPKG